MAISLFKSFRSSVTPFIATGWTNALKLLVDPQTGAPVGIQSQNANGPDGIWTPIDLTAAQIAAPTPAMIADLNATYRLSVAPYTRYQSDGTQLVAIGWEVGDGSTFPGSTLQTVPPGTPLLTIGVNSYAYVYSPFTVQNAAGVSVQGRLDVVSRPS
jgi:hypothetical protein